MEDLSEKEQLDMMRTWWAENGRYVVGGVVLGVAILFGWNQWQSGIVDAQLEASTMYEDVMTGVGDGNAEAAAAAAAVLFESHAGTEYASQGRLAMARLYMDKGRDQDAVNVLQGLIDEAGDNEVVLVGRLRLAQVLLYQNKADEVVALLKDHRDNAFASRFNEILGDAYVALGSYAEADVVYNEAVTDVAGARTVDTNLIQLKINDLPLLDDAETAAPGVDELPDRDSDAVNDESPDINNDLASDAVNDELPDINNDPASDAADNELPDINNDLASDAADNELPDINNDPASDAADNELPDINNDLASDAADNELPDADSEPASDAEQESAADEQDENGGDESPQ